MNKTPPKFGADSPEIAERVMDEHVADARRSRVGPGYIIGWTAAAVVFVIAWGFTLLALSAAIYGTYRLLRWSIGWF